MDDWSDPHPLSGTQRCLISAVESYMNHFFVFDQDRQKRSESTASFLSYVNNKRRTSTILMKPLSHAKQSQHHHHHHHHYQQSKDKQKFLLVNTENRLIPVESSSTVPPTRHRKQLEEMRRELTQALHNIRYIAAHCAHESLIGSIRAEWRFIATVIDRLQFLIFLAVTFFGSLALLYRVSYSAEVRSKTIASVSFPLGPSSIPIRSEWYTKTDSLLESEYYSSRTDSSGSFMNRSNFVFRPCLRILFDSSVSLLSKKWSHAIWSDCYHSQKQANDNH